MEEEIVVEEEIGIEKEGGSGEKRVGSDVTESMLSESKY